MWVQVPLLPPITLENFMTNNDTVHTTADDLLLVVAHYMGEDSETYATVKGWLNAGHSVEKIVTVLQAELYKSKLP